MSFQLTALPLNETFCPEVLLHCGVDESRLISLSHDHIHYCAYHELNMRSVWIWRDNPRIRLVSGVTLKVNRCIDQTNRKTNQNNIIVNDHAFPGWSYLILVLILASLMFCGLMFFEVWNIVSKIYYYYYLLKTLVYVRCCRCGFLDLLQVDLSLNNTTMHSFINIIYAFLHGPHNIAARQTSWKGEKTSPSSQ